MYFLKMKLLLSLGRIIPRVLGKCGCVDISQNRFFFLGFFPQKTVRCRRSGCAIQQSHAALAEQRARAALQRHTSDGERTHRHPCRKHFRQPGALPAKATCSRFRAAPHSPVRLGARVGLTPWQLWHLEKVFPWCGSTRKHHSPTPG